MKNAAEIQPEFSKTLRGEKILSGHGGARSGQTGGGPHRHVGLKVRAIKPCPLHPHWSHYPHSFHPCCSACACPPALPSGERPHGAFKRALTCALCLLRRGEAPSCPDASWTKLGVTDHLHVVRAPPVKELQRSGPSLNPWFSAFPPHHPTAMQVCHARP